MARAYGVVTDKRAVPFRWTFYIGKDGKILKVDRKVKAATDGATAAATLKALGVEAAKEPGRVSGIVTLQRKPSVTGILLVSDGFCVFSG